MAALVALAVLPAACQPLPHPFADDRPPAALLRVPDSTGVSIAPIVGEPAAVAAKLRQAVAQALLKHEIPASNKTASLRSYHLYGRVARSRPHKGRATVTALWRLYDAAGRTVAERKVQLAAKASDWQSAAADPIARLARLSADALAPLLLDKATPAAAPPAREEEGVRVAVGRITGAPGDGANALATAVAAVLRRQNVRIVAADSKADLYIDGTVAVGPAKGTQQHVKIVWHVRRAGGGEIGTVGQENEVPRGRLDGAWGDIAYSVAIAAGDGLMQLLARGAPEPKSATGKP